MRAKTKPCGAEFTRKDRGRFCVLSPNAWRQAIAYGSKYTVPMIWAAAQEIYANNPELLEWARITILGG